MAQERRLNWLLTQTEIFKRKVWEIYVIKNYFTVKRFEHPRKLWKLPTRAGRTTPKHDMSSKLLL